MKRLFLLIFTLSIFLNIDAQERFAHRFNPIAPPVDPIESQNRDYLSLNGSWKIMTIQSNSKDDFKLPTQFVWDDTAIKIPSQWNINSYNRDAKSGKHEGGDFIAFPSYPKKWDTATIAWMQRSFTLPNDWNDKNIFAHFTAIMGKAEVYINGKRVGGNFEEFLPMEWNISQYLKTGENEILVGVAKPTLFDEEGQYGRRTYVGGSQGRELAGIWQDVYLLARPKLYVSDLFVKPFVSQGELTFEVEVKNDGGTAQKVTLNGNVYKWINLAGHSVIEAPEEKGTLERMATISFDATESMIIEGGETRKFVLTQKIADGDLEYWSPDSPSLYGAVVNINNKKSVVDTKYERFGWREFKIDGTNLLLNGKKIVLRGDSWHFMMTPQMTRRYAWSWYNMLKDAGANAVRLHAQPFPEFYLDMADEMGICVLDESGMWSSDGGPKYDSDEFWANCEVHLKRLIMRDRNHSSVFGWSVCNEVLPIIINAKKGPEYLIQKQVDEINNWVKITRELDPTRSWISGDGETMRKTDLPTVVGHYGDLNAWDLWSSQNVPWGMGECGKAYFGTPLQVEEFNGNRAYESALGRMEAIALEGYKLLKEQEKRDASYLSIFNVAWYALQPLNLGKPNTSTASTLDEGIFFDLYEEDGFGWQPERLGPYTTTFNPGYDNNLPLYNPWPLFNAVKCANKGLEPDFIDKREILERKVYPTTKVDNVILSPSDSSLAPMLNLIGVTLSDIDKATSSSLIIIDGSAITSDDIEPLRKALTQDPKVYITNLNSEKLSLLNSVLPISLELLPYKSTSYVVKSDDALIQNIENRNLYFSELLQFGQSATKYTLGGEFIDLSDVLVVTAKAEWQAWNYQKEAVKTARLFRSQLERDVELPVIAKYNKMYVNSLDLSSLQVSNIKLMKSMLQNMGVVLSLNNNVVDSYIKDNKQLSAMFTSKTISSIGRLTLHDATLKPYIDGENKLNVVNNNKGIEWNILNSVDGEFDFSTFATNQHEVYYLGFWLFSPRSLTDLLAEPDMPKMDIVFDGIDPVVYLNEKQYSVENGVFKNAPVDKGWNYVVVKFIQKPNEDTKFTIKYISDSEVFMNDVKSQLSR